MVEKVDERCSGDTGVQCRAGIVKGYARKEEVKRFVERVVRV
jgi:hypothetical protein